MGADLIKIPAFVVELVLHLLTHGRGSILFIESGELQENLTKLSVCLHLHLHNYFCALNT